MECGKFVVEEMYASRGDIGMVLEACSTRTPLLAVWANKKDVGLPIEGNFLPSSEFSCGVGEVNGIKMMDSKSAHDASTT